MAKAKNVEEGQVFGNERPKNHSDTPAPDKDMIAEEVKQTKQSIKNGLVEPLDKKLVKELKAEQESEAEKLAQAEKDFKAAEDAKAKATQEALDEDAEKLKEFKAEEKKADKKD